MIMLHRTRVARRRAGAGSSRGQALVEFAAVLMPVLLIVVGLIQFGLLFGANVSITNAAREGARAGTIYVYDNALLPPRSANDLNRCTAVVDAVRQSMGLASASAPQFNAASPCPTTSADDHNGDGYNDTWENGDLVVSYCSAATTTDAPCPNPAVPSTFCTSTDGAGCLIRVQLTYRSDIIVPFMDVLLPTDANGRFLQRAVATMVIN